MNILQHISQLDTILRRSSMSKDSRISFPFLIDTFNGYRASHCRESYAANMEYDTSLFQNLGGIEVTPRSLQDDPTLPASCINVGKCTIPSIVSMVNNAGLVSVSALGMRKRYYPCGITELPSRMTAEDYKSENWYAKVGNTLWITPYAQHINVVAILVDPFEGWVFNTETISNGELIYTNDYRLGEEYVVKSGSVIHNGVQYTIGQRFRPVNPNYTGNGVLDYVNRKRKMTVEDEYPMSGTMIEIIKMKILTQDFRLQKNEIADLRNNMKDEAIE